MFPNTRKKLALIKTNSKKIQTMMLSPSLQLKMFISRFRECESAEEERNVLLTECTFIRDAFRSNRFSNINQKLGGLLKLIYIETLGIVDTHKGAIAIMEMLCAKDYESVRIACLAAMLLLDETSDLMLMMTNAVHSLLENKMPALKCQALSLLANIGSMEMSTELAIKVSQLIRESTDYQIRKKAHFCGYVIVRKVPELGDMFYTQVEDYGRRCDSSSNSILLVTSSLIMELCRQNKEYLRNFRHLNHPICRALSRLRGENNADYVVNNVNDPFLQVRLIKFLALLEQPYANPDEKTKQELFQSAIVPNTTQPPKSTTFAPVFEACRVLLTLNCTECEHRIVIEKLEKYTRTAVAFEQRYMAVKILGECFQRKPAWKKWVKEWWLLETDSDKDISGLFRRKLTIMDSARQVVIEAPKQLVPPPQSPQDELAALFGLPSTESSTSPGQSRSVPVDNLIDLSSGEFTMFSTI